MSLTGWVNNMLKLPVLQVQAAAPTSLMVDGETVCTIPQGVHVFPVPTAPAGVPAIYQAGSDKITLTRPASSMRYAHVTGLDGRGVTVLHRATGDIMHEASAAETFQTVSGHHAVTRYAPQKPPAQGDLLFLTETAEQSNRLRNVLTSRGAVVVATGAPVKGVPAVRVITVTDFDFARVTPWGAREVRVKYVETSMRGVFDTIIKQGGIATYREARNNGLTFRDGSYLDIARKLGAVQ